MNIHFRDFLLGFAFASIPSVMLGGEMFMFLIIGPTIGAVVLTIMENAS